MTAAYAMLLPRFKTLEDAGKQTARHFATRKTCRAWSRDLDQNCVHASQEVNSRQIYRQIYSTVRSQRPNKLLQGLLVRA